jgi:integrase
MQLLKIDIKYYTAGLYVYCSTCKKKLASTKKYDVKNKCEHPIEKQVYKVFVYPPGSRKVKSHVIKRPAKNEDYKYNNVVKEAKEFYDSIKNPQNQFHPKLNIKEKEKPGLLKHCIEMYVDYIQDEDVSVLKKKHNSKVYIDNIMSSLKMFKKWLEESKGGLNDLFVDEVTEALVDEYCVFLHNKYTRPVTFNNKVKDIRIFFNYLIKKKGYDIINPVDTDNYKEDDTIPRSITKKEFNKILEVITPENGILYNNKSKKKVRTFYRDWLKDVLMLALLTGRRREEVVNYKFTDILIDEDGITPVLIRSEDYKNNRSKNLTKRKKMIYTPLHKELKEFLSDLGMEDHLYDEKFIIAPDDPMDRKSMYIFITKAFSHYAKIAGVDLTYKSLRKSNITQMEFVTDGHAKDITRHSNQRIIDKHYIDLRSLKENYYNMDFNLL